MLLRPKIELIGVKSERFKEEVEELGGRWLLTREPLKLFPGVFTTGEVERVTEFERSTLKSFMVKDGKLVEDPLIDDLSLAINLREGLIVISGCSHAGIVNIVRKAKNLAKAGKIKAVIGGFHLVNASTERIEKTLKALQKLGVEKVYTGHCTGLKAECMFAERFKEDFKKLYCGLTVKF